MIGLSATHSVHGTATFRGQSLFSWAILAAVLVGAAGAFAPFDDPPRRALPPGVCTLGATGAHYLAFSPDSRLLAAGHLGPPPNTRIYDVVAESEKLRLPEHGDGGLAFHPDGTTLASGGRRKGDDLRLWNIETGKEVLRRSFKATVAGHEGVWTLAYSADGEKLALGCIDGTIRLLRSKTGDVLRALTSPTPSTACAVVFSPNGRLIAAGSHHRSIRLWSSDTGQLVNTWFDESVTALAYMSDGRRLISGDFGRTIRIWDTRSGNLMRIWQGHSKPVRTIAVSHDERVLYSGGDDGSIRIWEVTTGRERKRLQTGEAVWCCAASPDGKLLAIGNASTLTLYALPLRSVEPPPLATRTGPAAIEESWAAMLSEDAAVAYRAMLELAASPAQSIPFLRGQWDSNAIIDPALTRRRLEHLDSPRYYEREQATTELGKQVDVLEPELRRLLTEHPPPEVERRLIRLLEGGGRSVLPPKILRWLRAVELLEWIGTSEAKTLLSTLGEGVVETLLAAEARSALKRLHRQR